MQDALDLLSHLQSTFPNLTPAISLKEQNLIITLCDQSSHKFYTYQLDECDLFFNGEGLANQIVEIHLGLNK